MQHVLVALQWEKSSCCSILIFVISLFGCPPAFDSAGFRWWGARVPGVVAVPMCGYRIFR